MNKIKTVLAACLASAGALAQNNVIVIEQPAFGGANEPSIYISPADTSQIVLGANITNVFHSTNGGRTWKHDTLASKLGVWGDPVVVADSKGDFYFFHLSDPEGTNWDSDRILDRIVVQKSKNGGKTWDSGKGIGLNAPRQQDKEWAAVNPNNDHIAVTWTEFDRYNSKKPEDKSRIMFSKSTNRGKSWSEPITLSSIEGNCLDQDSTTEGSVPAWGLENELFVAWSFDSMIYFNKSLDGGKTWLDREKIIAEQPGGWSQKLPGLKRANGFPVVKVDHSNGKHRGRLYINWTDQRNGEDDTDVFIMYSDDRGESWSDPIRVNNDQVAVHQFFTWLDIDPATGYLYTVFYDRRNHLDNTTDVYLAISKDGGNTWANHQISETPFKPVPHIFFGDYNNISVRNGMIRPAWTHYGDNKLSVRTAILYQKMFD